MKYRILGSTGIEVSEIGFGTWGLGGNSYGTVDDDVSKDALRFAFDSGLTFYDTSDLYGNGHSEEILGDTLHDVRDKIIISTKVGLLPHTGFDMPCDFSPSHIRQGLDDSLRRLRSNYIDIYLLHSPTIAMLREDNEIVAILQACKEAGKIRTYGISVRLGRVRRPPGIRPDAGAIEKEPSLCNAGLRLQGDARRRTAHRSWRPFATCPHGGTRPLAVVSRRRKRSRQSNGFSVDPTCFLAITPELRASSTRVPASPQPRSSCL